MVSLEILTLLLENSTEDSVEVAIGFLKECGQKLTEVSPRGINGKFKNENNSFIAGWLQLLCLSIQRNGLHIEVCIQSSNEVLSCLFCVHVCAWGVGVERGNMLVAIMLSCSKIIEYFCIIVYTHSHLTTQFNNK